MIASRRQDHSDPVTSQPRFSRCEACAWKHGLDADTKVIDIVDIDARMCFAPCRRPPFHHNGICESRVGASRRCLGASGHMQG
eukprot:8769730-Pyramimonas_sp.AAC.1